MRVMLGIIVAVVVSGCTESSWCTHHLVPINTQTRARTTDHRAAPGHKRAPYSRLTGKAEL